MADSPPPPPPPPLPLPHAPTTITALSDDLLLEIFLRLPDVTCLARAAFACRAFLHAVRSSAVFRRRFRQLHAPPLLALFVTPYMRAIVPAAAGKCSDVAAAAFNGLLRDSDASEWRSYPDVPYHDWYAYFFNRATDQGVYYSPHSQALKIFPKNFRDGNNAFLEFHTLPADGEEKRPSRVVCVHRDRAWAWARVAVFSSHTIEWQVVLPEMEAGIRMLLVESHGYNTVKVVNGFVCWVHTAGGGGRILALNTATFQYLVMDLPPHLKVSPSMFQLGQTKDGEFCVVSVLQCMLFVWVWEADGDGVDRFMLHKMFSLRAIVSEAIKEADVRMQPMALINGFVYLSLTVAYSGDLVPPQWFLSFCLETAEVNLLHKESKCILCPVDPYIMVSWPSSLIHGKEDSETGVIGNISEDDGPMGTDEASPVLFTALQSFFFLNTITALQSFKAKLIDDDNSNFAEIDSFLLDDERNSLLNRIATLESGLAAARDRVLRICTEPNSMEGMKFITSESELAAAGDSVLRIGSESDSMEGMEKMSCWQMCKVMLGRACSRFFTR